MLAVGPIPEMATSAGGRGREAKKFRPVGPMEYNTHPNAKENKKRSRGDPCGVRLTRGYV